MKAIKFKTIAFDEEHIEKGFETILFADTVVFTADNNIFHVPESTLKVLMEKHIPFTIIKNWYKVKEPLERASA